MVPTWKCWSSDEWEYLREPWVCPRLAKTKIASTLTCKKCRKTGHSSDNCQPKEKSFHRASCMVSWRCARNITDDDRTFVKLEGGTKILIVNAALGREPILLADGMAGFERDLILLGIPEKVVLTAKVPHKYEEVGESQQEETPWETLIGNCHRRIR